MAINLSDKNSRFSLDISVCELHGVGETRYKALSSMGIETVGDLIRFYPRAYQNRGETQSVAEIKEKLSAGGSGIFSVVLTVASEPVVSMVRRGMVLMKIRAFDETGSVQITYFNQQYLRNTMHTGSVFRFYGRVTRDGSVLTMANPINEPYIDGSELRDIVPVYSLTAGIKQKFVAGIVSEALRIASDSLTEFIPTEILSEMSLPTYSWAMNAVHHPETTDDIARARRRIMFNELFLMMLSLDVRGESAKQKNCIPTRDSDIHEFTASLPYELTNAQKRCISEIISDMSGEVLMNRILTGDVGSGKTIVAGAACYAAVKNGYRAALMVPTEILAEQHAADFTKLFEPFGIKCSLLTGSTKKKDRDTILAGLRDDIIGDKVDIVIGTQALISENVVIDKLGLAVIDEQHRFGVAQRAALFEKANDVHCLVMSATPIPRTMTLASFGSIAISRIDELPKGRQKIDTFIVNEGYRNRLIAFIRKQADEGHQTYVVCPAVEENTEKETDVENIGDISFTDSGEKLPLKAAETMADILSEALPDLKVGLIHGKMKSTAREKVMREFEAGELNVLVSTTVIEVGVNVPNASLMIVENAERFGLSQLHQLRGRVGRGQVKSYFVLVSDATDSVARERLSAIKSTTDGFEIAQYDLEQRGPGDFFSDSGMIRQSGEIDLGLAASCTDTEIIEKASCYAKTIVEKDPTLSDEKNKAMRRQLARFIKSKSKTQN